MSINLWRAYFWALLIFTSKFCLFLLVLISYFLRCQGTDMPGLGFILIKTCLHLHWDISLKGWHHDLYSDETCEELSFFCRLYCKTMKELWKSSMLMVDNQQPRLHTAITCLGVWYLPTKIGLSNHQTPLLQEWMGIYYNNKNNKKKSDFHIVRKKSALFLC